MANMYDPTEAARSNAYYKRNHLGKVTCTLCNVYCNDESNFLRHLAGKTHALQMERLQRSDLRRRRLEEEERANAAAYEQAERERAMQALTHTTTAATSATHASSASLASSSSSSNNNNNSAGSGAAAVAVLQTGRFGTPLYTFRTEHDSARGLTTKVWLDFYFAKAEEGTRPLHRWMSAREQRVEAADDYFVYLVVACDGYTTVALKFPASVVDLHRVVRTTVLHDGSDSSTSSSQQQQHKSSDDDDDDAVYRCSWDMLRKVYALYFVLRRTVA